MKNVAVLLYAIIRIGSMFKSGEENGEIFFNRKNFYGIGIKKIFIQNNILKFSDNFLDIFEIFFETPNSGLSYFGLIK